MKARLILYARQRVDSLSLCIAAFAAFFVSACALPQGKLPFTCTHRDRVVTLLKNDYGEKMISASIDERGFVIERWEGGAWTLLETRADAITCVITTGWMKHTDA